MPPSATRHPYPRPHDNPHRLAPATHRAPVVELLRGKVESTAIETVRKRDFGLSSQLSDYEPPFIKPNVDQEVQRTGVAARCCTTVRRATRNGGNAECLKIVDNTRALVRPDAPLGVARYVAALLPGSMILADLAFGGELIVGAARQDRGGFFAVISGSAGARANSSSPLM